MAAHAAEARKVLLARFDGDILGGHRPRLLGQDQLRILRSGGGQIGYQRLAGIGLKIVFRHGASRIHELGIHQLLVEPFGRVPLDYAEQIGSGLCSHAADGMAGDAVLFNKQLPAILRAGNQAHA